MIRKRVPSEFGIIIPQESGINWVKQTGGMNCTQTTLEGVFIPFGKMKHLLGYPSWIPEGGTGYEEALRNVDLTVEATEEEYESFPIDVQERGFFSSTEEYRNWIDNCEWYGSVTLWDDLRRYTYGLFDHLDSDPRERWDSSEEIMEEVRKNLPFEYQKITNLQKHPFDIDLDEYPTYSEPALRIIQIEEAEEEFEDLEGRIVFLTCPNAD